MAIVALLANGKKLVVTEVSLSNSATTTQDVSATVTVSELAMVEDVLGVVPEDANNSGFIVTLAGDNKLNVTARSVPAGQTTKAKIAVVGL